MCGDRRLAHHFSWPLLRYSELVTLYDYRKTGELWIVSNESGRVGRQRSLVAPCTAAVAPTDGRRRLGWLFDDMCRAWFRGEAAVAELETNLRYLSHRRRLRME